MGRIDHGLFRYLVKHPVVAGGIVLTTYGLGAGLSIAPQFKDAWNDPQYIVTVGNYTWDVPYSINMESWEIMFVDLKKFDKYWRRDESTGGYVGPGCADPTGLRYRCAHFEEWLRENPDKAIHMPRVSMLSNLEVVSFTDGRHRTRVMMDRGVTVMPMLVSNYEDHHMVAQRLFGVES